MARALIVGCGCRGRSLGRMLLDEGWQVRGTSRGVGGLNEIAAAGMEAAEADPERPGTVLDLVGDVTVVVWLLGSAVGPTTELEAIHGPRLASLLEKLVDTPVRGFAYQGAGSLDDELLAGGRAIVSDAAVRWRIPVTFVEGSAGTAQDWADETVRRVVGLIGERSKSQYGSAPRRRALRPLPRTGYVPTAMSEEVVNWAVLRECEQDAVRLADELKAAGHEARLTGAHTLLEMRLEIEGGAEAAREEATKILDSVSNTWTEVLHAPKIALHSD